MNVKGGIMDGNGAVNTNWDVKEEDDDICDSIISIGSDDDVSEEDSINSVCSFSSLELAEEEASSASTSTSYLSTSSSSSSHSNGPLYELSELMNNLPIKRGLSMFYQGKAQSFSSLARVQSIEDLPKKERPYRSKRMMKSCKSYAGGLDSHRISYSPKATISKKSSRATFASVLSKKGNNFLASSIPSSSFAVQKNF